MWGYYSGLLEELGEWSTAAKYETLLHRINLDSLLSRLDTSTKLVSLEFHVHYTDHLLLEQMFRVPRRFKIDVAGDEHAPYLSSLELQRRSSLRSKRISCVLADQLIPASLARRPKDSFSTLVGSWLSRPWANWARNTLISSPFGRAVFQSAALHDLGDYIPRAGMQLWPLLNVLMWGDDQFAAS